MHISFIHYFSSCVFDSVSFDGRGLRCSLHAHMILWVEDFPRIDHEPIRFLDAVDAVVQTEVPRPEHHSFYSPELRELVLRHQRHRFTHSKTCRSANADEEKRDMKKDAIRQNAARKRAEARVAAVCPIASPYRLPTPLILDVLRDRRKQERRERAALDAVVPDPTLQRQREFFRAHHLQRRRCRFGFPHPPIEYTRLRQAADCTFMTRGDRDILWRRRTDDDCWINNYVPAILLLWGGTSPPS